MAIAMEFFNIIVPKKVLDAKYPGGAAQCMLDGGPSSLQDDFLVRGGAMNWFDVEAIIRKFEEHGIQHLDEKGNAKELVVVDMINGPRTPCDWIEFDNGSEGPRCWLKGTEPGELSKPDRPDNYEDTIFRFGDASQR